MRIQCVTFIQYLRVCKGQSSVKMCDLVTSAENLLLQWTRQGLVPRMLEFLMTSSSTKIITLNTNTREILIWGGLHTSSLSNYAIFPKPLITQGCLINLANPSLSQFAAINRALYKMLLWLLCDCTRLGSIPGMRSGHLIIWRGD